MSINDLKDMKELKCKLFNKIDIIDKQINSIITDTLKSQKLLKNIKWTKITKTNELFECWSRVNDIEHLFPLFSYDYHKHYDVELGDSTLTFNYYDSDFYIQFNLSTLKDLIEMGFNINYVKDLILEEILNEEVMIQKFTKEHNDEIYSLKSLIKEI